MALSTATSDSAPSLVGQNRAVEQDLREYLMAWYAETPADFEVDWNGVQIKLAPNMPRAWGNAKYRSRSDSYEIAISRDAVENHDWEEVEETVRHEAIHIWQAQQYGMMDHGYTFTQWADKFGCTVRADGPSSDYKYEIHCANCGMVGGRMMRSKLIKRPENYECSTCGGALSVTEA